MLIMVIKKDPLYYQFILVNKILNKILKMYETKNYHQETIKMTEKIFQNLNLIKDITKLSHLVF